MQNSKMHTSTKEKRTSRQAARSGNPISQPSASSDSKSVLRSSSPSGVLSVPISAPVSSVSTDFSGSSNPLALSDRSGPSSSSDHSTSPDLLDSSGLSGYSGSADPFMPSGSSGSDYPSANHPATASDNTNFANTPDRPIAAKRTIKDSVFTNLFRHPTYLLQLYQALHPEDQDITEADLTDITIRNILTDNFTTTWDFLPGTAVSSWLKPSPPGPSIFCYDPYFTSYRPGATGSGIPDKASTNQNGYRFLRLKFM